MKPGSVFWTSEEVEKLADLVISMRQKEPGATAVSLVKRAQKQLPSKRQRKITGNLHIKMILKRVSEKDRDCHAMALKCTELEAKLSFMGDLPSDREELLESLTDDDLIEKYMPRLLQLIAPEDLVGNFRPEQVFDSFSMSDLAASLARRVVGALERPIHVAVNVPEGAGSHQMVAKANNQKKKSGRKLRILVVGIKAGNQRQIVEKAIGEICQLRFLAANQITKDMLPTAIDRVVIWSKTMSHRCCQAVKDKYPGRNIIEHFGGVDEMINLIEGLTCALR